MRRRDGWAVLALALACIAIAAVAERWRVARTPEPIASSVPLPRDGLVVGVASVHLGQQLRTGVPPFWAAALRPTPHFAALDDKAPGALGIYRRGWVLVTSQPVTHDGAIAARFGSSYALASSADRVPRAGAEQLALPLPQDALSVVWARPSASAWVGALPSRAEGVVVTAARKETWRLVCPAPCLLDALSQARHFGSIPALQDAIPGDCPAIAEASFDPERLESALAVRALNDVERFLGFPLRRELGQALAGHAVVALIEEPDGSSPVAILAVFDLARPDVARSLVERSLALGVLSGEVSVERYRDVMVGAWTRTGTGQNLRPAVAVDGGMLIVATRKSDLFAAIDRRRSARPRTALSPVAALSRAGDAAWRGWSRSAYLANAWFELLTGRSARPPLAAEEVSARLVRRDGGWVIESEGGAPAFVADPVLPALHVVMRAARATR